MAKVLGFYAVVFSSFLLVGGLPRPSSFAFRRHSKHLEIRSRLPYKDPVRPQQYLQYHTKIQFQITIQIPVKHSRITRCPPSAHPAPTRAHPAPTGAHQHPPDAHQRPPDAHQRPPGKVVPPRRVVIGHCFLWFLKFLASILPCFLCFFL